MWSVSRSTEPFMTTSRISSTYLFQSLGLISSGAVAMASCSSHSIYKLATIGLTGEHIAVQKFLLIDLSAKREIGGSESEF